ncbi:MAG: hypothetical protein PUE66_07925 [Erysipelotrichaceae bacterium]|nr:hypothetical protein [Erysipelotrichaceae bacterium]
MERELTGIYFRVKRDDKYENIDFTDLTFEEQQEILDDKNKDMKFYERMFNLLQDELGNLINSLNLLDDEDFIKFMILSTANQIKIAGDMFDIVREYEDDEEELTDVDLENMEIDQAYEDKMEEKLFN